MRTGSMPWFMGLCLSVAACACTAAEEPAADANDPAPDAGAATPGESASAVEGAAPSSNEPDAPVPDGDGGAPLPEPGDAGDAGNAGDADAGGGGGQQIPMPPLGKLHASASTGEVCEFTVDGVAKGTSTVLDVLLSSGTYVVACKRNDGAIASQTVAIAPSKTTTAVLAFAAPANGKLIATAIGGTCAFSINGSPKGTTTTLTITLAPATYLVACKPTTGAATISKNVTIKPGETALTAFQVQ